MPKEVLFVYNDPLIYRRYCVIIYVSHFCLPNVVQFYPIPALYTKVPAPSFKFPLFDPISIFFVSPVPVTCVGTSS